MRSPLAVTLLAAFAWGSAWAETASAQSLDFGSDSDVPIEIYADQGIEWQRQELVFIANGNARAVRGEVTVRADVLRAYYREKAGSGTDIWRLDAQGAVKITAPNQTAVSELAVYDVDNSVLVLSGGKVRLDTDVDHITADQQVEYWEKKQLAVARGNAIAVREDKKIHAEVLAAYFRRNQDGKNKVHRVEAFDNVRIDAASDVVTADRGIYNVESGIATLTGSVMIERGSNRLKGCSAEVNLNTSVSKLFACGGGEGGGRVRGVLQPGDVKNKSGPPGR